MWWGVIPSLTRALAAAQQVSDQGPPHQLCDGYVSPPCPSLLPWKGNDNASFLVPCGVVRGHACEAGGQL